MRRQIRHRDPDVTSLLEAAGGLADAKSLVITQARRLNALYRDFESGGASPLERLKFMASMRGLDLAAMDIEGATGSSRDAVVMLTGAANGKQGQIMYNPARAAGRVLFSIAHEISHTFFPSTTGGIRFREMSEDDSTEMSELERLCDAGAAELLMPLEEFRAVTERWSLTSLPRLTEIFGASLEAATFRLASAHPGVAAAGLLKYRRTKGDEAKLRYLRLQRGLFGGPPEQECAVAEPKYRRQSLHTSESFPQRMMIHWNKSFDLESVVYAADRYGIVTGKEPIPSSKVAGIMEAMDAPYQRSDADPDHPDLLFFWQAV